MLKKYWLTELCGDGTVRKIGCFGFLALGLT